MVINRFRKVLSVHAEVDTGSEPSPVGATRIHRSAQLMEAKTTFFHGRVRR